MLYSRGSIILCIRILEHITFMSNKYAYIGDTSSITNKEVTSKVPKSPKTCIRK